MSTNKLLLIFTRNPVLGKCKTRLAAVIGDQNALEIYNYLLAHTAGITADLNADKTVFYSERIEADDVWDNRKYQKKQQLGSDLGERMENAFQWGFEQGYQKVILIGSDLYDLCREDLETAFKVLDTYDYVLGPATDGGYYLLGMKQPKPIIFQNKAWGTPTVLENTLKALEGETVYLLEARNDVDLYEDIKDVPVFKKYVKNTYDQ